MTSTLDAVARGRLALAVALMGIASLVSASTVAPTATAQAVAVLAVVTAAVALAGTHRPLAVPHAGAHSSRAPLRAARIPLVLAGRATDVVHQPVRPRAPGRA